jgi:hypothetical protein
MEFAVGNRVKFLDEEGEGVIHSIKRDTITVHCDDGFTRDFQPSEILLISGDGSAEGVGEEIEPTSLGKVTESSTVNKGRFAVGDTVEFLDDVGRGRVVSVDGSSIQVLCEDGLVHTFNEKELILHRELDPNELGSVPANKEIVRESRRKSDRRVEYVEWDLHAHEILPSTRGMTNHEIVQAQLRSAKEGLDKARKDRIPNVIFIHGVGKGKLKEELRI